MLESVKHLLCRLLFSILLGPGLTCSNDSGSVVRTTSGACDSVVDIILLSRCGSHGRNKLTRSWRSCHATLAGNMLRVRNRAKSGVELDGLPHKWDPVLVATSSIFPVCLQHLSKAVALVLLPLVPFWPPHCYLRWFRHAVPHCFYIPLFACDLRFIVWSKWPLGLLLMAFGD